MAKPLTAQQQEQIKSLFIAFGSIRDVAKKLNLSRNTVRKVVRQIEGIQPTTKPEPSITIPLEPNICHIDFVMLEKLFELGRTNGENMSFENDLKKITSAIAKELGVSSTTDQLKLEGAMFSLIVYRRFYMNSLSASDKRYNGCDLSKNLKSSMANDHLITGVGMCSYKPTFRTTQSPDLVR